MKVKRLVAAVLCAAMVITSQGVVVSADEIGVPAQEISDYAADAQQSYDNASADAEEALNTSELPEEQSVTDITEGSTTIDEADTADEQEDSKDKTTDGIGADTDDDVSVDNALDPSPCFVVNTDPATGKAVLGLNPVYTSLSNTGFTTVAIPAEVEVIPKDSTLFYRNSTVKTVEFVGGGNKELTIEAGAFEDSVIETFISPANYFTVKQGTFQGCTNLKSFDFKNISVIESNAFDGCTSLGNGVITWSNSVEEIGSFAFRNSGFKVLDLSAVLSRYTEATIGSYAFSGSKSLTSITVPAVVDEIPDHCFSDCNALSSINIKGSAILGEYAFRNCTGLKEIKTGVLNVNEIKDYAFSGCTALTLADLPKSVIYIGKRAFEACTKLVTVKIRYQNESTGVADDLLTIEDDAFPDIYKNITLYGFDGVVKDYALSTAHHFKGYVTLFEKLSITGSKENKRFNYYMSLTTDQEGNKARPGTKVTVTIHPRVNEEITEPRRIQRNSLYDVNGGLDKSDIKFISGSEGGQNFQFIMPDTPVVLDMDPGLDYFTDANIHQAALSSYITAYDENGLKFTPSGDNSYNVDRPGYKGILQVNADKNGKTYNIGEWMFDYSSSDTKVVTVNNKGVISTVGSGLATVTAKYKNLNQSVKIQIYVGPPAEIANLSLFPTEEYIKYLSTETETIPFNDKVYEDVPVLEIPQNVLKSANQEIKLKLYATEEDGTESFYIHSGWYCGSTKIGTLKKETSDDNSNTITINKGVSGETYVRASHDTGRKTAAGKSIILFGFLVIKVVDITPRITAGDIRVDINKDLITTGGTPITIAAYSGYEIDSAYGLTLWMGDKRVAYNGLYIVPDGGNDYRLVVSPNGADKGLAEGKSNIYTGTTKLYIRGQYTSGDAFEIPVTKVIVENKKLELKMTSAGTINLFYNASCYNPLSVPGHENELARKNKNEKDVDYIERYINATVGKITLTNNISKKTAVVDHAQLWTESRWKEWKASKYTAVYPDNDTEDALSNNFTVSINEINRQNLTITRSTNEMAVEKREGNTYTPIVSGYLAVYFEGYSKPLVQQIKISNKKTPPTYSVSPASVVDNNLNKKGTFKFKILNGKKKPVITEDSTEAVWLDSSCKLEFDEESVGVSGEFFTVATRFNDGKKTAKICIQRKNWDAALKYNFTVSYTDRKPTAKFSTSSPRLNTAFAGVASEFTIELNEVNCVLELNENVKDSGLKFLYTGSARLAEESDKISIEDVEVEGEPNKRKIVVTFDEGDEPIPGSYKFSVLPQYNWSENAKQMPSFEPLKVMNFTLTVVNSSPVVKLSTSSYTFNMNYPEKEVWEASGIFKNLPTGLELEEIDDALDTSSPEWVLAANNPEKADPHEISDDVAAAIKIDHRYDETKKKEFITFTADESEFEEYGKFSFTYYLNGITIKDIPVKENALKVTVKGSRGKASVTVSASGAINTIDYTTNIKYKANFKGVKNPVISNVVVYDVYEDEVSEELYAVPDEKEKDIFHLYAYHPDDLELSNVKHPIQLIFDIVGDESLDPVTKTINVTPVQKTPKLSIDKSLVTFNQGVAAEERIATVTLTKTSELKTHITGVKLKDTNSKVLRGAFTVADYIDLDEGEHTYANLPKGAKTLDAGVIVLQCVSGALLDPGKTYNVVLEVEFDGQFYKRNKYGELLDKDGNITYDLDEAVKINGSTITVPVVVYK